MYQASQYVIKNAKNASNTLEQQQYWTLASFRYSHDHDHPLLKRSLNAYPHLQQYFHEGFCTHKQQLHDHLEDLTRQLIELRAQRKQNPNDLTNDDHHHHHKSQTNNLQSWISRWSSKKRKSYTLHITKPDGTPTHTTQQSAQELHKHWLPSFTETAINLALARTHLDPFIQTITHNDYNWTCTFEQFLELLQHLHDTAPGPIYSYP